MKIYCLAVMKQIDRKLCRWYTGYTVGLRRRSRSRRHQHKSFIPQTARGVVTRNTSLAIRSISSPTVRSLGPICLATASTVVPRCCVQSSIEHSCCRVARRRLIKLNKAVTQCCTGSTSLWWRRRRNLSVWRSHPACLLGRELAYKYRGMYSMWTLLPTFIATTRRSSHCSTCMTLATNWMYLMPHLVEAKLSFRPLLIENCRNMLLGHVTWAVLRT